MLTDTDTNAAVARLSLNPIAKILATVYDMTALEADPIYIEWASRRLLETNSTAVVAKALRQINSLRARMGKQPAYPRFGTPLFGKL